MPLKMMMLDDGHAIGIRYQSVPVFAEGRVENQKLNQTAAKTQPNGSSAVCCRLVEFLVFNLIH